jgi:hypothetical protein
MADSELAPPTIELTHQRVTTLSMGKGEVEALVIAEVVRRARIQGIIIDLSRGVRTRAEVSWRSIFPVTVEIVEDLQERPPAEEEETRA